MGAMQFVHESFIPAPVHAVFAFHERPEALRLLTPPWQPTEIIQPPAALTRGTEVILRTRIGPLLWTTLVAEHTDYKKDAYFEDTQRRGPFAAWRHRHLFIPETQGGVEGTRLRDEVEYEPPLGPLGRLAEPFVIRGRLRRLFEYRHEVTRREVLASP